MVDAGGCAGTGGDGGVDPLGWDVEGVVGWLEGLGLGEYAGAFVEQAVNGACLVELSEADLRDELKVGPLGHRRLILRELRALHPPAGAGAGQAAGAEQAAAGRWVSEAFGARVVEACASAEGRLEVANAAVDVRDVEALGKRLREDAEGAGVQEVVLTDVAVEAGGELAAAAAATTLAGTLAGVLGEAVREDGRGLRRLGIRECGVDDEGACALAEALGRPGGAGGALLRGLDLEDNRLTEVACAALAAALLPAPGAHVPCLTSLNLGYNALGLEGLRVLARALGAAGSQLRALRLDRIGVSESVPEAVGGALGGLVRDSPSLLDVSFGKNNLRDAGAVALAIKLEEGGGDKVVLQRLRLSYNNVGDEGALALCTAAAATPLLRGLDLSANDVTKRGRQALREGKLVLVHAPTETQGLSDEDGEDSDRERDVSSLKTPAEEEEEEEEEEGAGKDGAAQADAGEGGFEEGDLDEVLGGSEATSASSSEADSDEWD